MNKQFELLAPGGDVDACKAAIVAGADAIFCGLNKFNARNRAANIDFDDLLGILRLAHEHDCEVFLTMNVLVVETEFKSLLGLLNRLVNTTLDGIIIQDIGLFYLLAKHFPTLAVHASTQTTTHNRLQMHFLKSLGADRANLSRELTISEIRDINNEALSLDMQSEVFVHGSNCLSFSGACYFSSVLSGNSGNRGRCSQPCRDRYEQTEAGKEYPLNLKDNSAYLNLEDLLATGVYSLKIEGRIKKSDYVYTVVQTFRKQLDRFLTQQPLSVDMTALQKVFNRDFTNAFLTNDLGKSVFIDNPRDYSVLRLAEEGSLFSKEQVVSKQKALLDEKKTVKRSVEEVIASVSTAKIPLDFYVKGSVDNQLTVEVKGEGIRVELRSRSVGSSSGKEAFSCDLFRKRLKAVEETEYCFGEFYFEEPNLPVFYSFKELNDLKKQLLLTLRNGRKLIAPVEVPKTPKRTTSTKVPKLKVVVDEIDPLLELSNLDVEIYFQLPSSVTPVVEESFASLCRNTKVVLFFPTIVLENDLPAYTRLLQREKPTRIVTNNSGIAFEAFRLGIEWIAGPYFNCINSYSLQALQEKFHCKGAFVSNELSQAQLYPIQAPESFELGYSIFHPSLLFTSRQCLFTQVSGCSKEKMDKTCVSHCNKQSQLFDEKGNQLTLQTSAGNHHSLYHQHHFLNVAVLEDVKDKFDNYLIDLTSVQNKTKCLVSNSELVELFLQLIEGRKEMVEKIHHVVAPTQNNSYRTGL